MSLECIAFKHSLVNKEIGLLARYNIKKECTKFHANALIQWRESITLSLVDLMIFFKIRGISVLVADNDESITIYNLDSNPNYNDQTHLYTHWTIDFIAYIALIQLCAVYLVHSYTFSYWNRCAFIYIFYWNVYTSVMRM